MKSYRLGFSLEKIVTMLLPVAGALRGCPCPPSDPSARETMYIPLVREDAGSDSDAETMDGSDSGLCAVCPPPRTPNVPLASCEISSGSPALLTCRYEYAGNLCVGGRNYEHYEVVSDRLFQSDASQYFSVLSEMEALSVPAFIRLRNELQYHRAPEHLIDGCSQSIRDEVSHAKSMRELAKHYGERTFVYPKVQKAANRPLIDIALENMREGCVGEAWAALVMLWQSRNAKDINVRTTLEQVAHDEIRHAELSWQIHEWIVQQLPWEEQKRVQEMLQLSLENLEKCITQLVIADRLQMQIGWPDRVIAREMLIRLRRALTEN